LQIYSLRSSPGFLKRSWDDECVVYIADARETHLLTAPCAHVLGLLEQGPASFGALHTELHWLLDGTEDQDVLSLLGQIVDTLGKIGLIESCEDVS